MSAMEEKDCIFCQISAHQASARMVYEDAQMCAFENINPSAPVHVLLIPRQHITSLAHCCAADAGLLGEMLLLVPKLARQLGLIQDSLATGGFRVAINTGPDGGQKVNHLHLHILGQALPLAQPSGDA